MDFFSNFNDLTYVLIGVLIVLVLLIFILSLALCRVSSKNKSIKTREIKVNSRNINARNPLVGHFVKTYDDSEEDSNNINNINGFKSFSSHLSEKPILDNSTMNSFSMKHQMNTNDLLDIPPAAYNSSTINRSMIENNDYSFTRGYLSPNINQGNYISFDIGQPSLQRISYCSTNTTNDSQYMPSLKTIMNYSFSEINDVRRNKNQNTLEHKQSKISSNLTTNGMITTPSIISSKASSVIAASIPGNNTNVGRSNMKNVPPIPDINSLNENSFQSNRSHISYSNSPKNIHSLQERAYQNPNISIISLPKSPSSRNYSIDNSSQDIDINLSNFHVGPSFSLDELDMVNQDCNIDDIDAIVNNAENMLDALNHHSLSPSNKGSNLLNSNNNRNSISPVDNYIPRSRNNKQSQSFQKSHTSQMQPSMDTFLRQIPEGEIMPNDNSIIDQSGYNSSFTQSTIKPNRLITKSTRPEAEENYRNVNIIPDELKAANSSFYLLDDEVTNKELYNNSNNTVLEKDNNKNFLKTPLKNSLSPTSPYSGSNVNSNFLNYKTQQIPLKNDPINTNNSNNIKNTSKRYSLSRNGPSLSIKTKELASQEIKDIPKDAPVNYQIVRESVLSNSTTLERQISPRNNINSSFIQNSSIKSPTNFFSKTPISPIKNVNVMEESMSVGSLRGNNSSAHAENRTNLNKMSNNPSRGLSYDESMTNPKKVERTATRGTSYDDYIGNNSTISRSISRGTINGSMDRSYMINNNSYIMRNASQKSIATNNSTLNRSLYYSSMSRSHISTLSRIEDPDSSVLTEGHSIVSVENIVPSVKHSHKVNNAKKKAPEVHKVEVSYSIDDIPNDVDINDELDEDVFMRPSMMRFVEVEPSPILQLEAQSTRISYISNQSSEPPIVPNQETNTETGSNPFENEKEDENTIKDDKFESPRTIITMESPNSSENEIIVKNEEDEEADSSDSEVDIKKIRNSTSSSSVELLKNNTIMYSEEEDMSSPTLNENTMTSELLKIENNQSCPKNHKTTLEA